MKSLVFLFLLEYLVMWVQAVPPIMKPEKIIKKITENDKTFNGQVIGEFQPHCTGGSGTYRFNYTYEFTYITNLIEAQPDGKIKLLSSAELNYEFAPQYNLWVKCIDTATNEVATEEGAFSLVLLNENEKPTGTGLTRTITKTEAEVASPNTNLGSSGISVTDPDTNDQLSWVVQSSSGQNYYALTPSSGSPSTATLSTKVGIDYEDKAISSQPCKELKVKIADPAGLFVSATITICITDVNDNSPVFKQTNYVGSSIAIGTPVGTTVATLTATDADAGAANQFDKYDVWTQSEAHPYFKFVGSAMQTAIPIDVPFGTQFEVIVIATDKPTTGKNTATATVTIFTETTTTTTTTVAPPSGYNFWDKKDNVIAFICLMIITGLIVGALLYGCYRYCKHGSCLPDCCNPRANDPETQAWGEKQNNKYPDDNKYDYGRTPTPRPGTTSISQIGYH